MMQWLIVTDLDNTLVGDNQALATLNQLLNAQRQEVCLVYSTGRSLTSYRRLRTEVELLEPDAVVTSVGTEIYESGSDRPNAAWFQQLEYNWNRELVVSIAQSFSELTPQEAEAQRPFKASYHLSVEDVVHVLPELEATLQREGLSAQVVYSSGYDLDILPKAADKGNAMAFVREQFGIELAKSIACGDSGNDCAFFRRPEQQGIIVGNAMPELLDWHHQMPSPHRYLAKAHYAAGIIEGLQYFQVLGG